MNSQGSNQAEFQLSPMRRNVSLFAIFASNVGFGIAFGGLSPLIALTLEGRGFSELLIGLNSSMGAIGVTCLAPLAPKLAVRFGSFRALAVFSTLFIGAIALLPSFDEFYSWLILRFCIGAGIAMPWVLSETWTNQITTPRLRGRIMAIHATTIAAGFTIGPVVLAFVGTDGSLPYYVCALFLVAAMAPLLYIVHWFPKIKDVGKAKFSGIYVLAPTVFVAAFVAGALDTTVFSLMPVWGLRIGLEEAQAVTALSIFIAGNLLLQVPIGWLGDRFGRRPMMILCSSVATLGALLTWQLTDHWYPMLIVMFIWGGFGWALYSLSLAMMGERFTGGTLAAANAAFIVAFEVANITAPPAAGLLMDVTGPNGLLGFMGGITFLFTILVVVRGYSRRAKGLPD